MTKSSNNTAKYRSSNGKLKKTNQVHEPIVQERETFIQTMTFNKTQINALFDTGANECLIRKDIVSDIPKKRSPVNKAKLFDGSKVDILGYIIISIRSNIEGKTRKVRFYVAEELRYPMIIGANEIRRSGVILTHGNDLLIDRVKVSGIGPVDALIDSGSTGCFIGKDVLTDSIISKIKPLQTGDDTGRLTDGSEMDLLGYVYLRVSYLDKTVELPFFVVEKSSFPELVLGTTWIRKSRAILQSDGRKLLVTFDGKKEKKGCMTDFCPTPYVTVDVEEIDIVSAMVDTGSSSSSIRKDMLTSNQQSNATSTPRASIMSNGAEITSLGQVGLNITFQGITTNIKIVDIESEMDDKLVLGMDWVHQTRAVLQSDGSEIIVSLPSLTRKKKPSNSMMTFLSKKWSSTFGSVTRVSSFVSNLM